MLIGYVSDERYVALCDVAVEFERDGRSNYINAAGLPATPVVNARLELPRYTDGAFSEWGAALDGWTPPSPASP